MIGKEKRHQPAGENTLYDGDDLDDDSDVLKLFNLSIKSGNLELHVKCDKRNLYFYYNDETQGTVRVIKAPRWIICDNFYHNIHTYTI